MIAPNSYSVVEIPASSTRVGPVTISTIADQERLSTQAVEVDATRPADSQALSFVAAGVVN
jgi:hypothetical protein